LGTLALPSRQVLYLNYRKRNAKTNLEMSSPVQQLISLWGKLGERKGFGKNF
jgi:hypothetical protein